MLYKIGLKFLWNRFWLYITWKNEQKILVWHFGICPGQCTSDRREFELSLCLIKEVGFRKNSLTKVMEILNNFYAKNSFSALCKKYQYKISVFWRFPSFLFLGLILVQTVVLTNLVFAYLHCAKKILGWHFGILTLSYTTHFPLFWTWFWFCFRQLC